MTGFDEWSAVHYAGGAEVLLKRFTTTSANAFGGRGFARTALAVA